jgi:hypothetical protein
MVVQVVLLLVALPIVMSPMLILLAPLEEEVMELVVMVVD